MCAPSTQFRQSRNRRVFLTYSNFYWSFIYMLSFSLLKHHSNVFTLLTSNGFLNKPSSTFLHLVSDHNSRSFSEVDLSWFAFVDVDVQKLFRFISRKAISSRNLIVFVSVYSGSSCFLRCVLNTVVVDLSLSDVIVFCHEEENKQMDKNKKS